MLFFIAAIPFYIPTNNTKGLQLLCIPVNTYNFLFFKNKIYSHPDWCEVGLEDFGTAALPFRREPGEVYTSVTSKMLTVATLQLSGAERLGWRKR